MNVEKEERVLKAFFFLESRFIVNKPVNWQLRIKGKQKRYFVRSFENHMDPCAYLSKWPRYAPAMQPLAVTTRCSRSKSVT